MGVIPQKSFAEAHISKGTQQGHGLVFRRKILQSIEPSEGVHLSNSTDRQEDEEAD
jgi:hypothetical protein